MLKDAKHGIPCSKFITNTFSRNRFPERLFHYTSEGAASAIQTSETIRFSKFDSSNDSLEFRFGIKQVVEELGKLKKSNYFVRLVLSDYKSFLKIESKSPKLELAMACFSTSKVSRYLWWNYSGKNKGRTLEFHFGKCQSPIAGDVIVSPVFYSIKKLKKSIKSILAEYQSYFEANIESWNKSGSYKNEMTNMFVAFHRDFFVLASLFKRRKFRKEKEFRACFFVDNINRKFSNLDGRTFVPMNVKGAIVANHSY